jgi:hypothetical protein
MKNSKNIWLIFGLALVIVLGLKANQSGWFSPRPPLELDGQVSLLFFNKDRGCECELVVYHAAEAQVNAWSEHARSGVPIYTINLERRPDLASQYKVIRAPTLILLDVKGQVVWRQDTGISDEAPLDLKTAESHISLIISKGP